MLACSQFHTLTQIKKMNYYQTINSHLSGNVKFTDTQKVAIDYAKAIGIILVLIGHYPNNIMNYFQPYIFHMPLFFFIGGMLFNPSKSFKSIFKDILIKYYLYIVVVYLFLAGCNMVLNHFFGTPTRQLFGNGFVDTIVVILNNNFHNNGFFLVGWFLLAFSFVYLFCSIILKSITRFAPSAVPLLAFLCVGLSYVAIKYFAVQYQADRFLVYNLLCQTLLGSSFYIMGFLLRGVIFRVGNIMLLTLLMLGFVTLSDSGLISPLGMAWSLYPKGYAVAMLGALLGIVVTFSLATVFSLAAKSNYFAMIGRNSKSVMCFHLLVFSLVDCLASSIGIFTIDKTELFTRYMSSYSFAIYMVLGLVVSMEIGKLMTKISRGIL